MRMEKANAKINLYLDVVSRRENGYHNIVSLMQTLSLCDLVTLDYRPAEHTEIRLSASGNTDMPTDRKNLAWRAAELFLAETGKTGEVDLFIEKHIPMAAGLAGGSADAAAVLRGLNALCGAPLSLERLCALGARLGADVPFCIVGGMALVTGIGEQLEYLPSMQRRLSSSKSFLVLLFLNLTNSRHKRSWFKESRQELPLPMTIAPSRPFPIG